MEISDDKLVQLFEDASATRARVEEMSAHQTECWLRIEAAQKELERQMSENRAHMHKRLEQAEIKAIGDRRFLRGVWVGVSLVCGSIGSGITLILHWVGTRH